MILFQFYISENPLDDCNFVYLDMGTNFGVQIRWRLIPRKPTVHSIFEMTSLWEGKIAKLRASVDLAWFDIDIFQMYTVDVV